MSETAESSGNGTVARDSPVPCAAAGSDPAAAAVLPEVQKGDHDPAWFSAGLSLAGSSPGYLVMRPRFSSPDCGSAPPALQRRGVPPDWVSLDFRPQTPAFIHGRKRPQPKTPTPRTSRRLLSCRYLMHNHSARHTNPIPGECVAGRPKVLPRYPAFLPARATTELYVAG